MSRSGYSDECEHLNLYRANVERVINSKRGQAFLRELGEKMDAMPDKSLIAGELVDASGQCCALGVICKSRNINAGNIDYFDPMSVGNSLGINHMMAAEIAFINDKCFDFDESKLRAQETPKSRFNRVRSWVSENIKPN